MKVQEGAFGDGCSASGCGCLWWNCLELDVPTYTQTGAHKTEATTRLVVYQWDIPAALLHSNFARCSCCGEQGRAHGVSLYHIACESITLSKCVLSIPSLAHGKEDVTAYVDAWR